MTNYEIYRKFEETLNFKAVDYRPLASEFVKGREGITIWLDNGDVILYFPSQEGLKATLENLLDNRKNYMY